MDRVRDLTPEQEERFRAWMADRRKDDARIERRMRGLFVFAFIALAIVELLKYFA